MHHARSTFWHTNTVKKNGPSTLNYPCRINFLVSTLSGKRILGEPTFASYSLWYWLPTICHCSMDNLYSKLALWISAHIYVLYYGEVYNKASQSIQIGSTLGTVGGRCSGSAGSNGSSRSVRLSSPLPSGVSDIVDVRF